MFTASAYTVSEDQPMLAVCVVLEGDTEIPITVVLSLQQDEQVPENMRATCKQAMLHLSILGRDIVLVFSCCHMQLAQMSILLRRYWYSIIPKVLSADQ